ncbi:ubiquitin carboxyl-terminal hydrolase 10-like [Watersipora subatra]|uniref:ubiquitin carboxyl-terminal hydrolase 10-like n=1 Tax=Watersipora subatra TaxID=2589382 RepID=UPI00355BAF8B
MPLFINESEVIKTEDEGKLSRILDKNNPSRRVEACSSTKSSTLCIPTMAPEDSDPRYLTDWEMTLYCYVPFWKSSRGPSEKMLQSNSQSELQFIGKCEIGVKVGEGRLSRILNKSNPSQRVEFPWKFQSFMLDPTQGEETLGAMLLMKIAGGTKNSPVTTPSTEVLEDVSTVNSLVPEPMTTTSIAKELQPSINDSKSTSLNVDICANSVSSSYLGSSGKPAVAGFSDLSQQTHANHLSSIRSQLSSSSSTTSSMSSSDCILSAPLQTRSWASLFSASSSSSVIAPADPLGIQKIATLEDSLINEIGALLEKLTINPVAVPLQARRLINKTNWCYVNSTLQALLACSPFYHTLKAIPAYPPLSNISARQSSMPVVNTMVEFVNAFEVMRPEKQINQAKKMFGEPFEPSSVYNVLKAMTNSEAMFTRGKQGDAEEFLTCLLNKMNEEMVTAINKYRKEHNSSVANGHDLLFDKMPTPILNIFGGQIKSSFHAGSKESVTLERFFSVPLNVQANKTVEEALHAFISKESIDDYTCPETKQELNAHRRLTFELLPPILILHLKCFVYDKYGGPQKALRKLNFKETLEFDKELLPNCGSKDQRSYKLFAVVYHSGAKTTGGHYHTDVYHTGVQSWVRFDDNSTSLIEKSEVFKSKHLCVPYLLYYRRADSK